MSLLTGIGAIGCPRKSVSGCVAASEIESGVARRSSKDWDGAATGEGLLLLHAEQGHGDTIQFARDIPLLSARGIKVLLENHLTPLNTLLLSLNGLDGVVNDGRGDAACAAAIPLLSLPGLLSTTLDTIPPGADYLPPLPADRTVVHAHGMRVCEP